MCWQRLIVAPLCLLVAGSGALRSQEKKSNAPMTEIGGKTLEYWVNEIASKDQGKAESAIQTVLLFGAERAYQAVPVIIKRLKRHLPPPDGSGETQDTGVRVHGMIALGLILGGYKEAHNKDVKDAVHLLRKSLKDPESVVKFRAAEALGRIGLAAKEATPDLVITTGDGRAFETRQAAVVALGQVAQDKLGPTVSVLNALFERLRKDNSSQVRLASIKTLTLLGGPVDPKLRADLFAALEGVALKDTEPSVRIWADLAVMSTVRNVDKDRVDRIARMLRNTEPVVRAESAQVLGIIGPDAKHTIPLLMKALNDKDITVRAWAVSSLGKMGAAAKVAILDLEKIKADQTELEIQRKLAGDAIDQINGK